MEFAAVVNNQPAHSNNVYSLYDPTYLKDPSANGTNQRIYTTGVNRAIGGFSTSCPNGANGNVTYYGSAVSYPCTQFSLNHRGYVYIHTTGVWTFTATGVDDAVIFWGGSLAQRGWTKQNANLSLAFSYNTGAPRGSVGLSLTEGTYLPVRIVFGQAVGGAGFGFSVADPNGVTLMDTNTATSNYLVRYSCDGVTAPAYAYPFGQEL